MTRRDFPATVFAPIRRGIRLLSAAYNLPGQPNYPDIFLGKITRWIDPRIVAANPEIKLPDLPITVVRRSDSSGTNFVFTYRQLKDVT